MSAFPKTAVGILSFMIFTGYLIFLVFGGQNQIHFEKRITDAQNGISDAAKGLNSDSGIFGSITAVFSLFFNMLLLILGVVIGMFNALAVFLTSVFLLPLLISQIIVTISSIGLLFAMLSKVIQT